MTQALSLCMYVVMSPAHIKVAAFAAWEHDAAFNVMTKVLNPADFYASGVSFSSDGSVEGPVSYLLNY